VPTSRCATPPPVVAPALRDVIQAVADAFNEVLGHREDDQIPVDDGSDSGDEVEEEQAPAHVAAPREGWLEELCTVDGRGPSIAHPHNATHLKRFEGSEPIDYLLHFLPAAFIQRELIPCINGALPPGAQLSYTEFLTMWLSKL